MRRDEPSRNPDGYTHGHHDSVLRSHRWRTVQNSAAYLLPHLRPGQDLLDVGCGPGTITAGLAAAVAPGRVVAVDRSPDVLAEAQHAAPAAELRVGDVYALDLDDDSFDVSHAHQVLQHVTDPVAALVEMRRVTRPGGLVAARDADYATFTWWPEVPGLREWLDLYHAVARSNDAEPDAGRRLLAWSHAAGLAEVSATASVWCFATPADRQWWSRSWAERATSSDFGLQAIDRGLAGRDDLRRIADAWREWGAHPDGWLSVVHGEVLAVV